MCLPFDMGVTVYIYVFLFEECYVLAPINRVTYVGMLVGILNGHEKALCSNESKHVNKI